MSQEATTNLFSSNAEAVITRPVDLEEQERRVGAQRREEDLSIEEFYEIEETSAQIREHGFKRVALQFPDEMLQDSVAVYLALGSSLKSNDYQGCSLFVLADTSYGSCCVDEVAAQHVNADAVVHYGHTCLSPTTRLPTIYVYGRQKIDTNKFIASISTSLPSQSSRITLRTDVSFNYAVDQIYTAISPQYPNAIIQHTNLPRFQLPASKIELQSTPKADEAAPDQESRVILYIGPESLGFTNLLMTSGTIPIYRYDPSMDTCTSESFRTNKLLMRRYTMVQRARDADVFGILVGTLGVASYIHLIKHLRAILVAKGKKTYTISVGKLNPAKLANFAEVECFVLVACPENSVIDSKEFLRPIVTPFELEMALGVISPWDGRYNLEFDKVLEEAHAETKGKDGSQEDEPEFSLITGKYRQVKRYGELGDTEINGIAGEEGAMVIRNQDGTVARVVDTAASEFMRNRTWRGLEQRTGQDEPSLLEQGKSGIARSYREVDHPHKDTS
ncbi:diphthamide biosynthesis protein [Serendipita vermifera]|nr:diphthamide biosynthesis protein [Serendipita vermifera]